MDRDGLNQFPVMTDNQVVGMRSRENVVPCLRTVQELGAWKIRPKDTKRGMRALRKQPNLGPEPIKMKVN